MAESFDIYLKRTEKYLHKLEKNEEVLIYSKKILCFHEAISLLYPIDSNAFLNKINFFEILESISKYTNKKLESTQNKFHMDYSTKEVICNGVKNRMMSSKEIVLNLFKINEQSEGHYLLISLISQKQIFELIQIYLFFKE